MKTLSTLFLVAVVAAGAGCGYGTKMVTPPVAGTAPAITSLSPSSVNAGAAGFVMTVNGSNFASNATVDWNGTAATTTFVTAGQLTFNVAAGDIATAGMEQVTVTNPAVAGGIYGGGTTAATSAAMDFTVN